MVGGTQVHREVIQREISRVLVLNLLWQTTRSKNRCGEVLLDKAFALIEGHPDLFCVRSREFTRGSARLKACPDTQVEVVATTYAAPSRCETVVTIGKLTNTVVPESEDVMSSVPPSWRIRSCIPRSPTPPREAARVSCLSLGMPLPRSRISRWSQLASSKTLMEHDELPECRWTLVRPS